MPWIRFSVPKVNRGTESNSSMPMVAIISPRSIAMAALARLPFSTMTMTTSAKKISANLPGVWMSRDTFAAIGMNAISRTAPNVPPIMDPKAACPSALAPLPRFISLLPSSAVIIDDGAPGMLIVIAVIDPEYIPDMKIDAHMISAGTTSI